MEQFQPRAHHFPANSAYLRSWWWQFGYWGISVQWVSAALAKWGCCPQHQRNWAELVTVVFGERDFHFSNNFLALPVWIFLNLHNDCHHRLGNSSRVFAENCNLYCLSLSVGRNTELCCVIPAEFLQLGSDLGHSSRVRRNPQHSKNTVIFPLIMPSQSAAEKLFEPEICSSFSLWDQWQLWALSNLWSPDYYI